MTYFSLRENSNVTHRSPFLNILDPDNSKYLIDTCKGDSGGPFMVEIPGKENYYVQTGTSIKFLVI